MLRAIYAISKMLSRGARPFWGAKTFRDLFNVLFNSRKYSGLLKNINLEKQLLSRFPFKENKYIFPVSFFKNNKKFISWKKIINEYNKQKAQKNILGRFFDAYR